MNLWYMIDSREQKNLPLSSKESYFSDFLVFSFLLPDPSPLYPPFCSSTNDGLKDLFLRKYFSSCIQLSFRKILLFKDTENLKWTYHKDNLSHKLKIHCGKGCHKKIKFEKFIFDFLRAICSWMAQNGPILIKNLFVENLTLFHLIPMSLILWYDDFSRKMRKTDFPNIQTWFVAEWLKMTENAYRPFL